MSDTQITTLSEALRSLEQTGIDRALIVAMNDTDYKELAAELGWTNAVAISARAKLRITHKSVPTSGGDGESSMTYDTLASSSTAATRSATATMTTSTASAAKIAELEARLAEAEAAAALSTKTRELAEKAAAMDEATFKKTTATRTTTSEAVPAPSSSSVLASSSASARSVTATMTTTTASAAKIAELQARLAEAEAAAALSTKTRALAEKAAATKEATFKKTTSESASARSATATMTTSTASAAKIAELEARLVEAKAAAALSTKTRALAEKAEAMDEATFKKITALHTATRITSSDLRTAVRSLAKSGTMQVAFVIDGTGSMAPHILSVRERIVKMAAELAEATGASVTFALVVYRDYEDGDDHINVFPFDNASALEATLGTVRATGGADAAEDCFGGLNAAMTRLIWSTPARLIIWIGDAPNHGTAYSGGCGDSHPSMDELPVSGPALGLLASQLGVLTSFIHLTPHTDLMISRLQQEYTEAGATLHKGGNGKNMASTIVGEMTSTALRTHTATKTGTASAPRKAVPLVPCTPRLAAYGRERPCIVYTAQPCNRKAPDGVSPFDLLLSEFPLQHEERRSVALSTTPFSKGEMRLAHHCKLTPSTKDSWFQRWHGTTHVAKTPILSGSRLGKRQMHMQTIACFLGNEFNARTKSLPNRRDIRYLPVQLMQLLSEGSGAPEGDLWMLEPYVEGDYVKFNNNCGHVNKALLPSHPIPQAFSHFTYEYSGGKLLVADVQGVVCGGEYLLTDPAIHTVSPDSFLPDSTNLGIKNGIAAFFKTHVCNAYCVALKLRNRSSMGDFMLEVDSPSAAGGAKGLSVSSSVLATHSLDEM